MELSADSSTLAGVSDEVTLSGKHTLIIFGAVAAVAIWYFGARTMKQREEDAKVPPVVYAAVAVGDGVLFGDRVVRRDIDEGHEIPGGFRLRLDTAGGGSRAEVTLDERRACGPASPGKIWCVYKQREERIEVRDAKTLAVVVFDGQLRTAMRAGLGAQIPDIDLDTGELRVTTATGEHLVLDATGPRARAAPPGSFPKRTFGLDHEHPRSLSKSGEEYSYAGVVK